MVKKHVRLSGVGTVLARYYKDYDEAGKPPERHDRCPDCGLFTGEVLENGEDSRVGRYVVFRCRDCYCEWVIREGG